MHYASRFTLTHHAVLCVPTWRTCANLLPSGLYRRLWSLTRSAMWLAGSIPVISPVRS